MSDKRYLLLCGLLLLLLVLATHGRSVWSGHGFVNYDDIDVVVENPRFQKPWPEAVGGILVGRTYFSWLPLYFLSLGLDHALFGTNPTGYHLVNVLLHALNALLVAAIALRLSRDRRVALAAGLVFALLPGLVESVAWVSSRKDVLSFLLLGLSLLLALRAAGPEGRPRGRPYVGSLVLLALAMMAKGTAVVGPLLLLAHSWLARRREPERALRPRYLVPHVVVAVALAAVHATVAWVEGVTSGAGGSILEILVSDVGVLGRYVVVLVLTPFQTAAHHVVPGTLDGWVLVGIAALLGLGFAIVHGVRRAPLLALGAVWFLLALAPFNNVLPRTSLLMAERYLYVPALGAALVAGWALARLPREVYVGALIAVAVALGAQTGARTGVWRDSEALWRDAAQKAPEAYVPQQKLGEHLSEEKRYAEARAAFERAAALATTPRDVVRSRAGLATVLLGAGRAREALANLDRLTGPIAELKGREAVVAGLDRALTRGKALEVLGRFDEALASYRSAWTLAPDDPRGPYDAGTLLLALQRLDEAERALDEAVRRGEAQAGTVAADALLNLTSLHLLRGRPERAEATLRRAEAAGADAGAAALRRARILRQFGKRDEAYALLEEAARRRPDDATLARAIATLRRDETRAALGAGDPARALEAAREAARWAPGDPESRLLLARVLRANGRYEEALEETDAAGVRAGERTAIARERAEIRTILAGLALGDPVRSAALFEEALAEGAERIDTAAFVLDGRLLRLIGLATGDDARYRDLLVGVVELMVGRGKEGRTRLAAVAGESDDDVAVAARATRAASLATTGLHERAIADLEKALGARPDSADLRLLLAEVLEASGKTEDALAAYEAARGAGGMDAEIGAARALARSGRLVEALGRLNDLASRNPGRPELHRAIAEIYLERHVASPDPSLLDGATRELGRALEADPRDPQTLTRRAQVAAARGRAGMAIALLRRALEIRPDLEVARGSLAALYVHAGRGQLEKGNLDEAEIVARSAVALAPERVDALILRGDVKKARKDYPAAFDDYERARVQDPDAEAPVDALADWYKAVGYHRLLAKDREGALTAFRQALRLGSKNVDLTEVRRIVEDDEGDRGRREAIETLLRKGRESLLAGDADGAIRLADQALGIRPKSPHAHFLKGLAHQSKGNREAAENAYASAIVAEPEFADAHLNLGSLLFTSGREKQALHHYRKFLEHVDPKTPGAAQQIASVRALVERLRERVGEDDR